MFPDPKAKLQKLQEQREKVQKQIIEDILSGRGIDTSLIDKDIALQEEQERILSITPPDSKTKR